MNVNLTVLTDVAKAAAREAGEAIVQIYNTADFGVETKADNSPLTLADKAAHQVIIKHLEGTGIPILSEEGRDVPYEVRRKWDYFWLVDPLDGTKEFIKKNGEFTVNIALIHNGEPELGVVYAPVLNWLYWGNVEEGAWKQGGNLAPVRLNNTKATEVSTVVASRSHLSDETKAYLERLPGVEVISMGSSLKFMLLAENKAQVYPRFAPTMEWDTGAAHGILRSMGAEVVKVDRSPLRYNKENLLNPFFICYNTEDLP